MKRIDHIDKLKEMEILGRIPLFKGLSAQERSSLVTDELEFYIAEQGDYVIKQNENDHFFYILLSGKLEITKNANHSVIAEVQPGDFVGEIAFITNQPRTAYVQAMEQSMVIRVDQTIMHHLPEKVREKIKDTMINGLVNLINHMNDEIIMLHDRLNDYDKKNESVTSQERNAVQLAENWHEHKNNFQSE